MPNGSDRPKVVRFYVRGACNAQDHMIKVSTRQPGTFNGTETGILCASDYGYPRRAIVFRSSRTPRLTVATMFLAGGAEWKVRFAQSACSGRVVRPSGRAGAHWRVGTMP